jgi:hypothetical protein
MAFSISTECEWSHFPNQKTGFKSDTQLFVAYKKCISLMKTNIDLG